MQLDKLMVDVAANPKAVVFEIEGHTDSSGGATLNEQIGLDRAEAVKRYLHEQHKVPLHKMSVISYGESRPVDSNRTRDGRAKNTASRSTSSRPRPTPRRLPPPLAGTESCRSRTRAGAVHPSVRLPTSPPPLCHATHRPSEEGSHHVGARVSPVRADGALGSARAPGSRGCRAIVGGGDV